MKIHFLSESGTRNKDQLIEALPLLIPEIYPEYQTWKLPDWLTHDLVVRVLEKKGQVLFVSVWQSTSVLEEILSLMEMKVKWQHFLKTMDPSFCPQLVIFGQHIPDALAKLCASLKDQIQIYEVIFFDHDQRILIRDPFAAKEKASEPRLRPKEEPRKALPVNRDTELSITSFFYKMGKLSESELSSFLDMEQELKHLVK